MNNKDNYIEKIYKYDEKINKAKKRKKPKKVFLNYSINVLLDLISKFILGLDISVFKFYSTLAIVEVSRVLICFIKIKVLNNKINDIEKNILSIVNNKFNNDFGKEYKDEYEDEYEEEEELIQEEPVKSKEFNNIFFHTKEQDIKDYLKNVKSNYSNQQCIYDENNYIKQTNLSDSKNEEEIVQKEPVKLKEFNDIFFHIKEQDIKDYLKNVKSNYSNQQYVYNDNISFDQNNDIIQTNLSNDELIEGKSKVLGLKYDRNSKFYR